MRQQLRERRHVPVQQLRQRPHVPPPLEQEEEDLHSS
jgi:hypothetical protein